MFENGTGQKFLGSLALMDEASSVLFGAPFDGTTSFMPGTRLGPGRIREASHGLEMYSPLQDRSLDEVSFIDMGDVELPFGNVAAALERIEALSRAVFSQGQSVVALGGEHLISLPIIRACQAHFKDLAVIQFDAHADLRDHYLGEHDSHATVMRRVGEVVGMDSLYQVGIRSGTQEEYAYGRAYAAVFTEDFVEGIDKAIKALGTRPVYVSIDVDVVDPGYAPGTGTPEPGGYRPQELFASILKLSALNVVAFDVVEVNPLLDSHWTTPMLGAKIVRECLLAFFSKANG